MRPIIAAYIVRQLSSDQSPDAERRRAVRRIRRSRPADATTASPVRRQRTRTRPVTTPQPTGEA
jgi:hypothetical protein